jgi:Cys-tRNA(Pro)/Cys-tRNA(Cys) deacylase
VAAKTPALAALERAGVTHRVHEYRHDAWVASYGLEAAEKLGVDPARVFKTLIVDVDGQPWVAIVSVERELDLRALGKRAAMAKVAVAERLTGYVMGGISPLGQRRRLPTILDDSALAFETIYVSGGRRGLEIELAPADLVVVTSAETSEIARSMT